MISWETLFWRLCLCLSWLCSRVYIAFSVQEKVLWAREWRKELQNCSAWKLQGLQDSFQDSWIQVFIFNWRMFVGAQTWNSCALLLLVPPQCFRPLLLPRWHWAYPNHWGLFQGGWQMEVNDYDCNTVSHDGNLLSWVINLITLKCFMVLYYEDIKWPLLDHQHTLYKKNHVIGSGGQ